MRKINKDISIVLTTYNGQKFIIDQIVSIMNQSYKKFELIICDDNSSDNTCNIIEEYIKRNSYHHQITLIKSEVNSGHIKNFINSVEFCKNDIIFFSDQDDIWHKDKLLIMTNCFTLHEDCEVVRCNSLNFYDCSELNLEEEYVINDKMYKKESFKKQIKNNKSGGLNIAFKKSIYNVIKETILKNNLSHDIPFGLHSVISKTLYSIELNLTFRRIHDNNVSAPITNIFDRVNNFDKFLLGRIFVATHIFYMCELNQKNLTKKQKKQIDKTNKLYNKMILSSVNGNPLFLIKFFLHRFTLINLNVLLLGYFFSIRNNSTELEKNKKLFSTYNSYLELYDKKIKYFDVSEDLT